MIRTVLEAGDLAAAFLFLHDLYRVPGPGQWAWLTAPETAEFWRRLTGALANPSLPGGPALPDAPGEYEAQYIAAFDAGAPHPPVPLLESHYNKRDPVPRVLHENVLFHKSFGLRLRGEANETADHLRHQLEFTAHLCRMDSESEGGVQEQVLRARHEFVERHLLSWLPRAAKKAGETPFVWAAGYLDLTLAAARAAARPPEID